MNQATKVVGSAFGLCIGVVACGALEGLGSPPDVVSNDAGSACLVNGTGHATGATNPSNACESCQPSVSTSAWTDVADGTGCGTGGICHTGACVSGCEIEGVYYTTNAPGPSGSCETCQPEKSTTAWVNVADGTSCNAGTSGTCCAGACVDEQTDNGNCGGCGLTCSVGCKAGECLVTLASGQNPYFIAIDSTSVYWTNDDSCGRPGCATGSVVKVSLDGGTPTTLASKQSYPVGIAVNDTSVYWAAQWDGTVMKCATGGCGDAPTTLASGQDQPDGIAVDSTSVYWTNNAPIGGTVMKCAIGGCDGNPTTLASGQTYPFGIAVDSANVYWGDGAGSPSNVMQVPLAGGTPITLATEQSRPLGITLDTANVYWVDNVKAGVVMKCAIGGCGETPTTLVSGLNTPFDIVSDGASLYWSNSADGTIMRMPITTGGGTPVTLAAGQGEGYGIAVDDTSVYWVNAGDVMKLTPK